VNLNGKQLYGPDLSSLFPLAETDAPDSVEMHTLNLYQLVFKNFFEFFSPEIW
jgi:hypothetical protein